MAETLGVVPSGYASAYSSYSSISSSYPITNAYADSSSTSYAYVTCKTGSQASSYISLTFSLSSIPDDAVITSVQCKAKGRISSTSYISTAYIQLYAGSTAKGSSTSFRTTTATTYTLTTGSWTRNELYTLMLRYTATRGTSNTTRAAYMYVYGADLTIEYEVNGVKYSVFISSYGTDGTVSPEGTQTVNEGDSLEIKAYPINNATVKTTINFEIVEMDEVTESGLENGVSLFHLNDDYNDELNNSILTSTGSFESSNVKFGNGAISLDGSQYITISLPQDYSPVTLELWFNVTKANTSGQYPTLFSTSSNTNAGGTYMHIDDGAYSTSCVCRSNASGSSSNNGGYGSMTITRNTWHHFAYCRNGSSHYFFIDGQLQYTVTQSSPNSFQNIYIGGLRGSSAMVSGCYMTGYIDEILVSNVCKWTSDFTPPTSAYEIETRTYYVYTIENITEDKIVSVEFSSDGQSLFYKVNGVWVKATQVYKKVNGAWVSQSNLSNLFDTDKIYIV